MQNDDNDDESTTPPEWTSYSTKRDRVKAVAVTVERPRTTAWIASESLVAKQDAARILDDLVNDGALISTTAEGGVTRYRADRGWVREETLDALRKCNSREDLKDMRDEIRDRLHDVKDDAQYRLLEFRLGIIEDEIDAPNSNHSIDENN